MLPYPTPTTLNEKQKLAIMIKDKLLAKYDDTILAIGLYGSMGLGTTGPYSDMEMHVITREGHPVPSHELIYGRFKVEISSIEKQAMLNRASEMSDAWPVSAGSYIHIQPIYDPKQIFEEVRRLPLEIPNERFRETMREFMIWEPYETLGKLRNTFHHADNAHYIPMGACDLTWQTAKLIGLANKQYYSTRARTYEESLLMSSKPAGYEELARKVMEGKLDDTDQIFQLCEALWAGLNNWFEELGIEYRTEELPW
ncbi:kanamycin nucleotidyltransferase C-terminal domain-containing protein [Alkalicoccobacillus murimartini]|uniref:Kanamycin nucleotidyltransferase n=1 Tax=Alkalicoccobacillus murimartini TaxID=171685 RepID=A0ABT9YIY6_9BACI|nr:kanamycin nucleotidyltransferase C-terminal domain-containing protein [Alkalicoccobacillus murimartini]MDQ0207568.1 kanamycin nucleotidyltransferase [Alkalicoccobacillus murimartini]